MQKLISRLNELSPLSQFAINLGVGVMFLFYIIGLIALLMAPYVENYFAAIALFHGSREAALASLASGVCAGLIGDIMLRRNEEK